MYEWVSQKAQYLVLSASSVKGMGSCQWSTCFLFICFWDKVSHSPGWPQTCRVAEDDPKLLSLLSPLAESLCYRHEPPYRGWSDSGLDSCWASALSAELFLKNLLYTWLMGFSSGVDFRGRSFWVLSGSLYHLCNTHDKWKFSLCTSLVSTQVLVNSEAHYFILCFGKRKYRTRRIKECKSCLIEITWKASRFSSEERDSERGVILVSWLHVNCTETLGSVSHLGRGSSHPRANGLRGFLGWVLRELLSGFVHFFPVGETSKLSSVSKGVLSPVAESHCCGFLRNWACLLAVHLSVCLLSFLFMCTELKSWFSFFCT